MPVDPATPVLVGVGTAGPEVDDEPVALMTAAATAALADAGGSGLAGALDQVYVPQGTWSYPDPGRLVAAALDAPTATTHLAQLGVTQQQLVNLALDAVEAGRARVALVVGGEARAWARRRARAGRAAEETPQPDAVPDVVLAREPDLVAPAEVAARLIVPVEQYAMIDQALGHAEGRTPDQLRDEIAALWARCNRVAQTNPDAAFPAPMSEAELREPSAANRLLADPYLKWHASQWTVDQAAALVVCSAGTAREHGVPTDRWLFCRAVLDATHAVSLSERRDLHRWPAMRVLGRAAEERIGRPVREVEHLEVYSCFPAAVRVQQRELGLDPASTPTLTGGMAFSGGPFNNFVYQATAVVARRVREEPDTLGAVTTVSGLLTKGGLAVWAGRPDDRPARRGDLAAEVAAATPTVPSQLDYRGPATIATYTLTGEAEERRVLVVADTTAATRCVAVGTGPTAATLGATARERSLIGLPITVDGTSFVC